MPTTFFEGKRVSEIELLDLFPSSEGMITQYYGRIGSGKTYSATADALELLRRGKVVYTNWKLHYEGTDERQSKFRVFVALVFPWIRRFYVFPKENLHYLEVDEHFHDKLGKLTDCHIFLDEGHVVFDSYEMAKMSLEKRKNVLHTRHFNRSIHIISQRPTAVHVTMRANVNVFYRCTKIWSFGPLVRFKRTEFQDMLNESVDENEEKIAGVKYYWGSKKVFDAYDSHYLRGDVGTSQRLLFEAYDYNYLAKLKLFFTLLFPKLFSKKEVKMAPLSPISPTDLYTVKKSVRNIPMGAFEDILRYGKKEEKQG